MASDQWVNSVRDVLALLAVLIGTPACVSRPEPVAAPIAVPVDSYQPPTDAYPPPPAANGNYEEPPPPNGGDHGEPEVGGGNIVLTGSRRPRAAAFRERDRRFEATAAMERAGPVRSISTWYDRNGALSSPALLAILRACLESSVGIGPACRESVESGTGAFAIVPEDARREFALLFQENCPGRSAAECVSRMQSDRDFRALPRGRFEHQPKEMQESVRTLFLIRIRDEGNVRGRSGMPSDVAFELVEGDNSRSERITAIPYENNMCFRLSSEDPAAATIEPKAREGTRVKPGGRLCMSRTGGGAAIRYMASWWVTPHQAGKLQLHLDTEYFSGSERRIFHNEPRPMVIDVVPENSLWEIINDSLRRSKETVGLATELVVALGALFTAISAWGIWKLIARWRKRRRARGQT